MGGLFESLLFGIPIVGLLIVVHELGHFLVAKWCGVGVLKFSVGFGPVLWKKRFGETDYQIAAIPLGGYVRMMGDMPDLITGPQESDAEVRGEQEKARHLEEIPEYQRAMYADKSRWFIEKGLAARSAIVIAGPLFNFIAAILIVGSAVWFYGEKEGKDIPVIGDIDPGSRAERAGLKVNDEVLSINGEAMTTWENVAKRIHASDGQPLTFVVKRENGLQETVHIQPALKTVPDASGGRTQRYRVGIGPTSERKPASLVRSLEIGTRWSTIIALGTLKGIGGMIVGDVSTKEIGGPILIFATARSQAKKGLEDALFFAAALSVSLAVLNLLPIPLLDGGHLLFFFLEALMGPMSMRKKEFAQNVGLTFLLLLMVFALFNDMGRVIKNKVTISEWDEDAPEESAPKQVPPEGAQPEKSD